MPKGRLRSIAKNRRGVYEAIKGRLGKGSAARTANAGKTAGGRRAMARKAAKTRKRGG
jgi:hypothetical protein